MFRQAKSAFIWYHLYKFRRTFLLIAFLLTIVLFSQWIYSDVVEYLQLRKKLEYLDVILPIKWAIIFFNMTLSVYLFLSLLGTHEKKSLAQRVFTIQSPESLKNILRRKIDSKHEKNLKILFHSSVPAET